jgi:hypothetical protein
MTERTGRPQAWTRLVWVGVIAAVAAVLTRLATESLAVVVLTAIASAVISMGIVWLVSRTRGPG